MALSNVQADHNVPVIGPRNRYSIIGPRATLHAQVMASGAHFDGLSCAQESDSSDVATLDPTVSGGLAKWSALLHGGLFKLGGKTRPLVIESVYANPQGGSEVYVFSIVRLTGTVQLAPPTPFKLAAGEQFKVTSSGGTGGGEVGVMVRWDGKQEF